MDSFAEQRLKSIIKNLEDAIRINLEAVANDEMGYPYAAGYSRSAMITAVEDLNRILSQFN